MDMLGGIARLLEQGTIRPNVAAIYALEDAAEVWKDVAERLWPGGPGASA